MGNNEKLRELLIDIFLLEEEEFRFDLEKKDIDTWDSLGTVSVAVGIQEVFGYHFTPDEAVAISSIKDIIDILRSKDVEFDD